VQNKERVTQNTSGKLLTRPNPSILILASEHWQKGAWRV
jgi:hypothetical protein